jgi:transposase-like protein
MNCKKCNANKIVKAGFVRGYQRYKCKECEYYFTDTPARGHSFQEKLLSLQLYASGLSLRRIGYLLHVSQVTIQKWVQKLVPELCPKLQPEGRVLVMELDEMWHYLHSKKTNSGSGKLCVVIPVDSLTGNLGVVIEKL